MLIYKGKTYENRKQLVKEIGANYFARLLKYKNPDLVIIYNENIIEGYELQKNHRKGSK